MQYTTEVMVSLQIIGHLLLGKKKKTATKANKNQLPLS